jgi:hypothetical protein
MKQTDLQEVSCAWSGHLRKTQNDEFLIEKSAMYETTNTVPNGGRTKAPVVSASGLGK